MPLQQNLKEGNAVKGIEVSAVIPVFNDREALARAIPLSISTLDWEVAPDFELIIAEDGSSGWKCRPCPIMDGKDTRVRLLHSDERLGRGKALNRAFFCRREDSLLL